MSIYSFPGNCCFLQRKRSSLMFSLLIWGYTGNGEQAVKLGKLRLVFETKKRERNTQSLPPPQGPRKSQEQTLTESHPVHHPNAQL